MLISRISEDNNEETEIKDNLQDEDMNSLSQRDLVILYENVDIGTKQTSNVFKNTRRTSNQYVETVIYNEDQESEGSDLSEIYCNEDLYDVVLINKERIDLLNCIPSLEKTLCQKTADLDIQSDLAAGNDGQFFFRDPFIKAQLDSLSNVSNFNTYDGTFLSTSLLDYISCNRLDDNYNFYMDTVIQYVKRTIEHLKRISNGDFLTDKAKEKWRKLENEYKTEKENETKVVATSKSNPLRVECNVSRLKNIWHGLVHSELDITTLSKMLEKKIIVEIPRLIYGSYRLFSKCYDSNLVICCKEEMRQRIPDEEKSPLEVVVQLKPSDSTNDANDVDSGLILQTVLSSTIKEPWLAIEYKSSEFSNENFNNVQNKVIITELKEDNIKESLCRFENNSSLPAESRINSTSGFEETENNDNFIISEISSRFADAMPRGCGELIKYDFHEDDLSNSCNLAPSPDDLFCSIQKLNTQTALLEEIEGFPPIKKKSPTKVRIKSPYENKTYIIEERKRRRLLEIRDRRERRKKALSEHCKVTKHKHGKGAVMAQPSNSVTKLSITNKSFYNSIYGENANMSNKHSKKQSQKGSSDISSEAIEESPVKEFINENKKYVNHSYYLDDPVTEVQIKNISIDNETKDTSTPSTSAILNDLTIMSLNSFNQEIHSSATDLKSKNSPSNNCTQELCTTSVRLHNTPPASTPSYNANNNDKSLTKKSLLSLECKKSIDKIYQLMCKLNNVDSSESTRSKEEFNVNHFDPPKDKSLTIQVSDSGTSLKHQLTSSNPSIYSFEETNNIETPSYKKVTKKPDDELNIVSKVIIGNKSQTPKLDKKGIMSIKKNNVSTSENISKNPLKAISHLINEFDHIQKRKQKTVLEGRDNKKADSNVFDGKNSTRHSFIKKVSYVDNQIKDIKSQSPKNISANDRKVQPKYSMNRGKAVYNQNAVTDNNIERDKKIIDIVDEALREARGEAVRGPSKPYTRLDALAQPKRFNVNGPNEAVKHRHGKSTISDKLSQITSQILEKPVVSSPTSSKMRQKRYGPDNSIAAVSKIPHYLAPPEKPTRQKRLTNHFNNDSTIPTVDLPYSKEKYIPETSRPLKRKLPIESNIKKHFRQLSLTQTAASSNLLEKNQKNHIIVPVPDMLHQTRDLTPMSSFIKEPRDNKYQSVISPVQNAVRAPLSVLNESVETVTTLPETKIESITNNDELVSLCSDYVEDILEDKDVLTAVSSVPAQNQKNKEDIEDGKNNKILDLVDSKIDGVTEGIENLEKALYKQMSEGVFQKRLKIKNLTLTPKQSINQLFLLQCGDANSLLAKSSMSQNLHINSPKSDLTFDKIQLPLLSKSCLDWSYSKFPVDVTTIGYAFPQCRSIECGSSTQIKCMETRVLFASEDLSNNIHSNDEKGVQTLQLDRDIVCPDFKTNVLTETVEEKISKGTCFSDSFVNIYNLNELNENNKNIEMASKSDDINNTTSLDILAELLEEIEKITKHENLKVNDKDNNEVKHRHDVSIFSENPVTSNRETCHDRTTYCLNSDNNGTKINTANYFDKEVAVNIIKECVNGFTDVPSQLWLPKGNSKNDQNSHKGIVSEPSSHSLVSIFDYRTLYSNKMKELSYLNMTCNQYTQSYEPVENKLMQKTYTSEDVRKYVGTNLMKTNRTRVKENACINQKNLDPILKIKKDILVTMYSILVFIVFAALSFPEFLYRT